MTESRTQHDTESKTMPGSEPTSEDLRHDVELTRDELADTASALAAKLDVKSRTSTTAMRQVATMQRHPAAVAGWVLGLLVLLVVAKRIRNNS